MGNIVTVEANAILASSVAGVVYTLATKPITLALLTAIGDATTKGTEVVNTGGSTYARFDTTTSSIWGSASGGSITNSVNVATFNVMPACTITSIELWDSFPRSVADGVTTSGSATITSATAAFVAGDVGTKISGSADIPGGTTIASVTNGTTAVMSAVASASHTAQVFNIVTPVRRWFGLLSASKTVNAGDTVTFATSSISITLS